MYNTIQKTIAAWAFNHYIAYYYFDNVNVSQLKVAFEKGEVELENLPIKKDALQHFNVQMDVVSGIVNKLSIKVPLLTLLTDPWVIKISHLMLIVSPKKSMIANQSSVSHKSNQSLNIESNDASLVDHLDSSTLDYDQASSSFEAELNANSEENKLAEFYSSFSATVSSIVKDIYKNIKLEIESMTILFEDFDNGLVKFSVDHLLLHRPKSLRNIIMKCVSIHLSNPGVPTSMVVDGDDLIKVHFDKCNLNIHDEASNNMQLVVVDQSKLNDGQDKSNSTANTTASQAETTSETKIEGIFESVNIEQHILSDNRNSEKYNLSATTSNTHGRSKEGNMLCIRSILKSDIIKTEFKLNNMDNDLNRSTENNLQIKLDLVGMQYIHSQRIYETTQQRLKNFLKFFIKLQSRRANNLQDERSILQRKAIIDGGDSIKRSQETNSNRLLMINIEDGLVYVVDDTSSSCAIPLLEFSLDNCRILQFSGKHQQNGLVFAKVGCNYYNREISTWNIFLKPWPFSFSWDSKSSQMIKFNRDQLRDFSLNSDEMAEFTLTNAFLDLCDVALRRTFDEFICPRPLSRSLFYTAKVLATDYDSIFMLNNETGHRLQFAPLEHNNEIFDMTYSSRGSPTSDMGSDSLNMSLLHKLSINSRSSSCSRESPDLSNLAKWTSVDAGSSTSFEFETLQIYRRRVGDPIPKSRVLLLRVEGWKTLAPICIDRTGTYFREASSDRVMNEDTYVVISVDLEETSARKVISIRSPINLVNVTDATLEVHFSESNQALYIKPDSHLSVPLPFIYNRMHIRPCSVGVTMSEQALVWDQLRRIVEFDSKMHICHPITMTDHKHASYCTSQPCRICVSTKRHGTRFDEESSDILPYDPVAVFTLTFIPPLTIVNLLPCSIQYIIGEVEGSIAKGDLQKVYHVDTTKPTKINFKMAGFPSSKSINIDPGATGSFYHTLEMFDKKNRSLYLNAKISFVSLGEEPAIEVVIYSPYWILNKTRLPLIFKQEGAVLEAAGQFREHEESPSSLLLFSFYDSELEPPYLCSMRLGKSKGQSIWCDGFKLEKGAGERRLNYIPADINGSDRMANKSLIDINIRRGFGRYSQTMIVVLTTRYGFDPMTKTPKKLSEPSPQNYRLASYNHNVNLAEKIADHAVNLFNSHQHKISSDVNVNVPGLKLTLLDNNSDKIVEGTIGKVLIKCNTKLKEQILDCSIQDIRINNVTFDCEKSVVLDRAYTNQDESINMKPALRLIMDRILGNSFGTTLFRQVQLSMCELVLNIEERLILKLIEFISTRNRNKPRKDMNNLANDLDKILNPENDRKAKYYFDLLRIDLSSIKLSVFPSTGMGESLHKLKSYLGLKFFGFEDAQVMLAPYFKMNISRTIGGVFDSVTRFYKRQVLEQAPRIVGQQIQNYLRFHLSDLLSTLYDEVYQKLFN